MSSNQMANEQRHRPSELAVNSLVIDPMVVQALVTAGFDAIQRNKVSQANQIFEFLSVVRPNKDFVAIGLALGALTEGRFADGEEMLRNARRTMQDSDELKAFHVLALLLCGRTAEARILQSDLAATAPGADIVRLAKSLGQEIDLRVAPALGPWQGKLLDQSTNLRNKP